MNTSPVTRKAKAMRLPQEVLQDYGDHGRTLYGLLTSRWERRKFEPLVVTADQQLTWDEFRQQVDRFAETLLFLGVQKGQRIAIASLNNAMYLVAIFSLAKIGAITVPINQELGVDEIRYIVSNAEVSGVIVSDVFSQKLAAACTDIKPTPWALSLDRVETTSLREKESQRTSSNGAAISVLPSDVWLVLYTSGTTGFPKGVMHTQEAFVMVSEAFVERMYLEPTDRLLCVLPLFHVNALFNSVGGAIAAGAAVVLVPRFSASTFWHTAANTRATEVNIIAAISHILLRRPESEFRSDHTIRKVYGVPVSPEIADKFSRRFGIHKMIEGYGLSEAPGVISNSYLEPNIGSMGRAAKHPYAKEPYAEIRIVDEDGSEVPVRCVGEIEVRTPIVMKGYFRDPKATSEILKDNWLKTGDFAWKDEDGYYYFVARKKEIIRRRGENISSAEIERVLREHVDVEDVAVIGIAADLGEEEVLAVVSLVKAASVTEMDIAQWCEERLASFKVPRYIALVSELPYTPTHRVAKHKLKEKDVLARLRARSFDVESARRARRSEPNGAKRNGNVTA